MIDVVCMTGRRIMVATVSHIVTGGLVTSPGSQSVLRRHHQVLEPVLIVKEVRRSVNSVGGLSSVNPATKIMLIKSR